MVQEGDLLPDFTLPGVDAQGKTGSFTLYGLLRQRPYLVLYIYPKDHTPGCTGQACDFRDAQPQWTQQAAVVGLSPDPVSSHERFAREQGLNFPLLSDERHEVIAPWGAYGEKKLYGKLVQGVIRSTFIIGADGRLVKALRNVKAKGHVGRVMQELEKLR